MEEKELKICCDASIKTFPDGRSFGCAGAVAIGFNDQKVIQIIPDTTSNRAELIAIYLAIRLAKSITTNYQFKSVTIYSDSKFGIYGLTNWMDSWVKSKDSFGIMYNSKKEPVKNQELFLMIISYLVINKMHIAFRHQKGHIKYTNTQELAHANSVFYESNHYYLDPCTLQTITLYNNIIDEYTREQLKYVNPNKYPIIDHSGDYIMMCNYVIPNNYKQYIL